MSLQWGGSAKGGLSMKTLWWILIAYEGVVGIAELANSSMSSSTSGGSTVLATIENLPSVASLLGTSATGMTSGLIDLGVAAGIWYFAT